MMNIVFWDMTQCGLKTFTVIMKESAASTCSVFYSEGRDSLQNVSKFLVDYITSHPRKQQYSYNIWIEFIVYELQQRYAGKKFAVF